ncbi:hypothetical protein BV22DRAFT_938736 [Leucogyrophana mollusca]|uniref:Uncharacterized protein n=1 Tax=Leucogyrophana mollusca TaxID=85980 RepID=A0ACB8AVV9_9AGAM|nr:hypothetical protein BV22DRAFT_938736 [Leucogyrophana mollusca]
MLQLAIEDLLLQSSQLESSRRLISVSISVHVTAHHKVFNPAAITLPFQLSGVIDNPCIQFIIPVKDALILLFAFASSTHFHSAHKLSVLLLRYPSC